MATIVFHEITKQYPGARQPAVDAISFSVPEGSTCMLVGTSGSGKTTLLRMVNLMIEPTSGQIIIDNKHVLEENPIQSKAAHSSKNNSACKLFSKEQQHRERSGELFLRNGTAQAGKAIRMVDGRHC